MPMTKDFTPQQILALELPDNDAAAGTVGQYLFNLTSKVWFEQEGFDGKRPFGNSGWNHDIFHALLLNGVVDGVLDEHGFIEEINKSQVTEVMTELFTFLNKADYSSISLPPEPRDWYMLEFDSYGELVGTEESGYTKAAAENELKHRASFSNTRGWKAVHIPQ